jgi:hypothetical protein
MAFNNHQVEEDEIMCNEADPVLKKLSRKASSIIQDLKMGTYWANTVGKTKMPGVYELHKAELRRVMGEMMYGTKMPYRELEDILVEYGYEAGDIRESFREATGVDPMKIELMRHEDMRAVPANIPAYNLGWGMGKKAGCAYFIMTNPHGLFTIYGQVSDTERKEEASFLRHDEALEHLAKHVKQVHCYSKSALEQAKYVESAGQKLATDREVKAGREGYISVRAADETADDVASPGHVEEKPGKGDENEELAQEQDKKVVNEVNRKTPQDFFKSSLPNRIDETAPEHIKNVLVYINNRNTDLSEFEVAIRKFEYMRHDDDKTMITLHPQTGKPTGSTKVTISALIEIKDTTIQEGKNKKFALAVFFVGPDGEITTSDSIKGEDEIIYGFTDAGMAQYFAKNRTSGAAESI